MSAPANEPQARGPETGGPSIHATCVAIGAAGVLIRGASGAGKSLLALTLILDAPRALPPAELVADDRVRLTVEAGRLVARPVPELAGLLEVRGLGIRRMPHRPCIAVRYVVDLAAPDACRLPPPEALCTTLQGIELERIPVAAAGPAPLVLACILATTGYEN